MKLQDICTSLELSKQLKEAGYLQESLAWWIWDNDEAMLVYFGHDKKRLDYYLNEDCAIAAPTASEIGEKLPSWIERGNKCYRFEYLKFPSGEFRYFVRYVAQKSRAVAFSMPVNADTEANARAKMWLYLKKEGLL